MELIKNNRIALLVLFVVSFLLFSNTINHEYVLDDFSVIKENYIVKKGINGLGEIFSTHYREGYGYVDGNLYRPLALSFFALQWEFFPDDPSFAHLCNVILYGLLVCLIYLLLLHLFNNHLLSFCAAMLFAAHPIHTEVVANIKSADDIMAFGLTILSLLSLLQYLNTKKLSAIISSLLLYFTALISKESVVTFIAIIPLILIVFKDYRPLKAIKTGSLLLIPFFIYSIMRIKVLGSFSGSKTIAKIDNMLMAAPDGLTYITTAIKIMGLYLWKLIVPHPLMNDYSLNQIPFSNLSDWRFYISLIAYVILIYGLYYTYNKKMKVWFFAIAFYLGNIALYSNLLIKIGTSFGERLLFIGSLGFCLALSHVLIQIFKEDQLNLKSKSLIVVIVISMVYGFKTIDRNKAWKDNFTLYETDVNNCDQSARCQYYYGLGLMKEKAIKLQDGEEKTELLNQAVEAFTNSLNILPTYSDAWGQRGLAFYRLNQIEAAIYDYEQSIKHNPNNTTTLNNLASLYFQTQRYDQAKVYYERAIRANPKYVDALANYASTLGTLGDFNSAITYFKKASALRPNEPTYLRYIAMTYENLGNQQQAAIYYQKAKSLE